MAVRLGLDRVDWARVGAASGLLLVAGGAAGLASSQFTAADEGYLTYAQLTYADDVEAYYRDHVETPTIVAWASVGTASASAGVSALLFATLKPRVAGVPAPVVVPVVTPSTVGVTGTF